MRFNIGDEEQTQKNQKVEASPEKIQSFLQSAQKLGELREEIERQKQALRQQFKTEFDTIIKDFFDAVPEVKSVTWTQYTPYFCDGDACYFGINELYFASDENEDFGVYRETDSEFEEGEGFSGALYSVKNLISRADLCETLSRLISGNEEIMEDIFGDHTIVRLTSNGSETSEYDHD